MHISNWGWTNHEFHKKGFVQNKTLRNKESYSEIYVILQLKVYAYFNSAVWSLTKCIPKFRNWPQNW